MIIEQQTQAKSDDKAEPKRSIAKTILIYGGKAIDLLFQEVHNVIQMFVWGDYYREGRRKRRKHSRKRV